MPGALCKSQDVVPFPWIPWSVCVYMLLTNGSFHRPVVYPPNLGSACVKICLVPWPRISFLPILGVLFHLLRPLGTVMNREGERGLLLQLSLLPQPGTWPRLMAKASPVPQFPTIWVNGDQLYDGALLPAQGLSLSHHRLCLSDGTHFCGMSFPS